MSQTNQEIIDLIETISEDTIEVAKILDLPRVIIDNVILGNCSEQQKEVLKMKLDKYFEKLDDMREESRKLNDEIKTLIKKEQPTFAQLRAFDDFQRAMISANIRNSSELMAYTHNQFSRNFLNDLVAMFIHKHSPESIASVTRAIVNRNIRNIKKRRFS